MKSRKPKASPATHVVKENKNSASSQVASPNAELGWVGVVGSPKGLTRLLQDEIPWWCLPRTAQPGALVAMYATMTASQERQGILGVFRVVDFEPDRDGECTIYGRGATSFVRLAVITRLEQSVSLKALRLDPILGVASCVRQNFQGT